MQSLRAARSLSMHEEVRPTFHTRLRSLPRLSSFAGQGLPERMRSTAFAFLGLTAAAGLALVAFFAQLGFPLLSPAPMPSDPSRANAVAEAKVVATNPGVGASVPALSRTDVAARGASGGDAPQGSAQAQSRSGRPADTPVASPQPAPPPGSDGGVVAAEPAGSPAPNPSPTPTATPDPAATPSAPKPAPAPSPKPEATPLPPSSPTPVASPGNSQSSAAASNASPQGIEASSNGNGKALGHSK